MADEQFLDVGKKPGLNIWRIEKFNLVKLNPRQYGTFFTGDSYLLLHTHGTSGSNLEWNIHFWLGKESTLDEMATAAIKAVELDDYLGGRPVQYREVQYFESRLFKSYFENGIRYLNGGVASGFNNIDNIEKIRRLYLVKGKRDVRVIEVELKGSSLNKSDVFILEDGNNIYQWNPPGSNRTERIRANTYVKQIRDSEHGGKATVHLIEDDWDTNSKFWSYFNINPQSVKENSDVEDKDFEQNFSNSNVHLYRISDYKSQQPTIRMIYGGPLQKKMLDSNDCFIVDCGLNGLYTWIGKKCTKNEKIASVLAAKDLMLKNKYPNYIPMAQMIDGGETTSFKSIFSDWN